MILDPGFSSRLLLLLVCLSQLSLPAYAILGNPVSDHPPGLATGVQAKRMVVTRTDERSDETVDNYTVQELVLETATVREFISEAGVVFAIVWKGQSPDLSVLLGATCLTEHQQGLKRRGSRRFGRRPVHLQSSACMVERWGHMRNLQGKAWIPNLVPNGVNIRGLQ